MFEAVLSFIEKVIDRPAGMFVVSLIGIFAFTYHLVTPFMQLANSVPELTKAIENNSESIAAMRSDYLAIVSIQDARGAVIQDLMKRNKLDPKNYRSVIRPTLGYTSNKSYSPIYESSRSKTGDYHE